MSVFVGVGSNLGSEAGDPRETVLRAAAELVGLVGSARPRLSPVYRTEPLGPVGRLDDANPDYANLVAELDLDGVQGPGPEELLDLCLGLERRFGRERGARNAPRTLDLDLLLAGPLVYVSPRLELPHPRLHLRRFVLVPLHDLAPGLIHPRLGRTVAELLQTCPDRSRVEPWPVAAIVAGGRP